MAVHGVEIAFPGRGVRAPQFSEVRTTGLKALLACGIAAPLLYVAMLVLVPMGWEGYSSASQTVSELSAIGAPTRRLWVALGIVYTLVIVAFGWGIWASARNSRALRVVGVMMITTGVLGLFWPPMHLKWRRICRRRGSACGSASTSPYGCSG